MSCFSNVAQGSDMTARNHFQRLVALKKHAPSDQRRNALFCELWQTEGKKGEKQQCPCSRAPLHPARLEGQATSRDDVRWVYMAPCAKSVFCIARTMCTCMLCCRAFALQTPTSLACGAQLVGIKSRRAEWTALLIARAALVIHIL